MTQVTQHRRTALPLRLSAITLLAAAAALSACERRDAPPPASETPMGSTTEQRVDEMQRDAREGLNNAENAVKEAGKDIADAGREVGQEIKQAGEAAGDKAADALITTKINAMLAGDANLSATRINVDTDHGRVVLKGSAKDAAAKDRATELAKGVEGVKAVENQLTIDAAP